MGVIWLHVWLDPKILFFSSGTAFLSFAPSSAKSYYATENAKPKNPGFLVWKMAGLPGSGKPGFITLQLTKVYL